MAGQLKQRSQGTWQIRVDMGRDPVTQKRRVLNRTVRGNKKDAQKVLNELLAKKDLGRLVEPSRMALSAYLDTWVADSASASVRATTLDRYKRELERYIKPKLGSYRLDQLNPLAVQEFVSGLRVMDLKPASIRHIYSVLHSALNQAVRWRLIMDNPARNVELPRIRRPEVRPLSDEEANGFLDAARGTKYFVLFSLLMGTGLRPSEALALRWGDINFSTGMLTVQRTVSRVDGQWDYNEPKTRRGTRSLNLPEKLCIVLLAYRDQKDKVDDEALVFPSREGTPLDLRNISNRHFKKILKRAGLPDKVRLYDLRHTHATLLLLAGVNPKIVSERLGHASVSLTLDTYSHVLPTMQDGAAKKIDGLLTSLGNPSERRVPAN